VLKPNILAAGLIGLTLGLLANILFVLANRVPVLNCIVGPIAFVVGLGLPILIGALAAAWSGGQGWMKTPAGVVDGAVAAGLAELVSRLIGFCVELSGFLGPRAVLPNLEQPVRAAFAGVLGIGWLIVSLVVAALLGALGGFLYNAAVRR
jgi:hypothetical protein